MIMKHAEPENYVSLSGRALDITREILTLSKQDQVGIARMLTSLHSDTPSLNGASMD